MDISTTIARIPFFETTFWNQDKSTHKRMLETTKSNTFYLFSHIFFIAFYKIFDEIVYQAFKF